MLYVVDPSLKEELAMAGSLTLTLNSHKELCCVQKAGGIAVPVDMVWLLDIHGYVPLIAFDLQIMRCAQAAATKASELSAVLEMQLKVFAHSRIVSANDSFSTFRSSLKKAQHVELLRSQLVRDYPHALSSDIAFGA